MDTNHSAWWDRTLQLPNPLPRCNCSAGREQGHASHPGMGWGHGDWGGVGVVLFCFVPLEIRPVDAPLQLGLDGGIIFYLAREWPAK